ncbi:MAG: hypothetical protein HYY35_05495 [Deltaproteobacteria bacterium]|nr:hypothetical protein [Deltaproteobacteria bacterium]
MLGAHGSNRGLLFCCLLVSICLGDLFSAGSVPLYGDLAFFVLPMKHFLAERIRLGEIPLWNPWIYMGTPFLAGLQSGVFYPPSALLALPFPLGFNLFLLVHYFIALTGAWALLRDRSLSSAACGVGSLTFVLGGYLISMMAETNHLQAGVWAPWVLLFWTRYCRTRERLDLARVVAVATVELLGGSPETMLMTLGAAASWAAYRSFGHPADGLRVSLALGGALLLVLLVGAFQILPTAEYVAESDRSEHLSFEEVSAWSLQPVSLLQLILPRMQPPARSPGSAFPLGLEAYAPWMQSLYLGVIPLCLGFVGLLRGRDRGFWAALVALGLLLALGGHSPVLPLLYDLAPSIFGRFRYPEKAYFLVHLGAAVLAAEGCEQLAQRGARGAWIACLAASSLLALAAVVLCVHRVDPALIAALVGAARGGGASSTIAALTAQAVYLSSRLAAIAGILLAIVWLRRSDRLAPETFAALLLLAVAVDLGAVHRGLRSTIAWSDLRALPIVIEPARLSADRQRVFHYQTRSASFPGAPPEPVRGLQELDRVAAADDDPRALWANTWRILFADIGMVYGVGSVSGGDGIGRRSNAVLLQALSGASREQAVRLLGLYSVGWLIGTSPLDEIPGLEATPAAAPSRYRVYRLVEPLAQARLVSSLEVVAAEGDALRRLLAADFPVESAAIVDRMPAGWSNPREAGAPPRGRVHFVSYGSDEVKLDVETAERAFLVLNDSYFPGWEADVDGRPAEIFQTNAFVRGLVVPRGRHSVRFCYRPDSWSRGAALSAVGLLALAALFVAGIRRRRRQRDPGDCDRGDAGSR